MPDADNNFGGSLGLDFRKWWRHVQTKNWTKDSYFLFWKSLIKKKLADIDDFISEPTILLNLAESEVHPEGIKVTCKLQL